MYTLLVKVKREDKMKTITRIIKGEEKEKKEFTTKELAYKCLIELRKTETSQDYWVMD